MSVIYQVNYHYPLPTLLGILTATEKLGQEGKEIINHRPESYNIRRLLRDLEDLMALIKEYSDSRIDKEIRLLKKKRRYPVFYEPGHEQRLIRWLLESGDITKLSGEPIRVHNIPNYFKRVRLLYQQSEIGDLIAFGKEPENQILVQIEPTGKYREWDYTDLFYHIPVPALLHGTETKKRVTGG